MYTRIVRFFFLSSLLTSWLFNALPAQAIDGHLRVTSPNGGENLKEGQSYTITWDASSNIDKIMLGWSSGPGSLNWIATSIPNTGSYTWNVNVGNTTNTQFLIDITGYETGKGSLSDKSDGYFTVEQKEDYPAKPPTPAPTPRPGTGGSLPTPTPTSAQPGLPVFSLLPTPTPTPRPVQLTYWSLEVWEFYTFDGSRTTDIKKLTDPKNVENFQLDTPEGFLFTFPQAINLTQAQTLQALQKTEDMWHFEAWWFWIEIQWWEVQKISESVEVTYTNKNLTKFTPTVKNTLEAPAPTKTSAEKYEPEKAFEVVGVEDDGLKVKLTNGAKLEITPRVELEGEEEIKTLSTEVALTGKSSHKDIDLSVKVDGQPAEVEISQIGDDGNFTVTVKNLEEGKNFVQLSYVSREKGAASEPTVFAERVVMVNSSWFEKYKAFVLLFLGRVRGVLFFWEK